MTLAHFAQHVAINRGKDDAMDSETILKVTLPIKINIDAIKKAQATERQVFECLEFFTLSFGATSDACDKSTDSSKELLERRCVALALAAKTAQDILKRMRSKESATCRGSELTALDEGFTAAVEVHESLPEWAFMQAGYELMRYGIKRNEKPKRKTKRRKRK